MGLAENRSNPAADGSYLRGEEPYAVRVGRAGGCDRAGARYAIGLNVDQSRFPWATLTIYLSGALLLGLFLTVALGRVPVSVMTPVAVGLIGGFTTFSTFAWEGFTLGRTSRAWVAFVYMSPTNATARSPTERPLLRTRQLPYPLETAGCDATGSSSDGTGTSSRPEG